MEMFYVAILCLFPGFGLLIDKVRDILCNCGLFNGFEKNFLHGIWEG